MKWSDTAFTGFADLALTWMVGAGSLALTVVIVIGALLGVIYIGDKIEEAASKNTLYWRLISHFNNAGHLLKRVGIYVFLGLFLLGLPLLFGTAAKETFFQ